MDNHQETYEDKLERLRQEYRRMLPIRLDEIDQAWAAVQAAKSETISYDGLYRYIHSIAGSGSTFGFSALSKVALDLEKIIGQMKNGVLLLDRTGKNRVESYLRRLRQAANRADEREAPIVGEDDKVQLTRAKGEKIYWLSLDAPLTRAMANQLFQFGYEIVSFSQMPELINRVHREEPNLIILDLYNENGAMDEVESLTQSIRQLDPKAPFICLCPPGPEMAFWLQAYRLGSSACFPKPLDFSGLLDQVHALTAPIDDRPFRLFIVDDDEKLVNHMVTILEKAGMVVASVTDPTRALKPIKTFKPDLILVDLYMPGCSGIELAQIIRQDKFFLGIPIVYLSRETEMSKQLEALAAGADDFLLKPVKYRFLYHSLSCRIKRSRQLRSFLTHDGLTELLNHAHLQKRLISYWQKTEGHPRDSVFGLFDIDDFKAVNDRYGHAEGDKLLKTLAVLLKRHLGGNALVGRYGGDEFVMVLPETTLEQAETLSNEIRLRFSGIVHVTPKGSFQRSLSCGLVDFGQCANVTQLAEFADKAINQAKATGKNKIQSWRPQPAKSLGLGAISDVDLDDLIAVDDDELSDHPSFDISPTNTPAPPEILTKIVVVDDDPQILQQITLTLKGKGFDVHTARSGEEGFGLVHKLRPDLVLIDLLLFPGIHGFELCQRIRAESALAQVKVVLMTAVYKDYRYRLEGKDAGADDFIEKPIDFKHLYGKIGRLLPHLNLHNP